MAKDLGGREEDRRRGAPQLIAAALKYDASKDEAPVLAAKGRGIVAEKILEIARRHGIPVTSDPALVQILAKLDLDEQIPVELYRAAAEILAFVYSLNAAWRERKGA
ncbi:MAG: Flagellar biosynthetic protein FlhB [Syntrophaceae bacterium PtaU1.Bin231]|nr:MAG: Flagellar biosynthetic protein FlhB [Syntrophaceae bacterium PtaU1.Bin231]HOG16768.1 EscU/YscU/HrcU family type III secretion system export apparatus switch protein [Syntrophales bacterium]